VAARVETLGGESRNCIPALAPHVEATVRDVSLRIYLHDSEDYDACCQIQMIGSRAWVHSITGAGFYLAMPQILDKCRELGLRSLAGYARAPHVRLMRRMAERGGVELQVGEAEMVEGHALVWVEWMLCPHR
jgi:hypothetical protein